MQRTWLYNKTLRKMVASHFAGLSVCQATLEDFYGKYVEDKWKGFTKDDFSDLYRALLCAAKAERIPCEV